MNRVKLLSLGMSLPTYKYRQEEAFHILNYHRAFWGLFRDSGIDNRYFSISLKAAMELSFQDQQDIYRVKAVELSTDAILNCLDNRDSVHIGRLVYGSCTGFAPGPTIAHELSKRLDLPRNAYLLNNSGMGCEAAFPGLKVACDHVKANGGQALAVNCELSSLAYYPELIGDDGICRPDPENDYEVIRANAVFADAAVCALVGDDNDWRHPEILDTETYTNPDFSDDLGFMWRNGRLRVKLSRRVPELAPLVVVPALRKVLARQKIGIGDIKWWVIHAAGNTVIDNIGKELHLPEDKLKLSRETLRLYGNTSSTSVGLTGKRLVGENIRPGDYVMMLSVGPGMSGGATCLRFPRS